MTQIVVLVLHDNRQYLEACVQILNEEWSRSKAARLHSLEKSNDKFPVNLVLVIQDEGQETVLGHSRLSVVQGKQEACLVESVVVKKSMRGKGYGRLIMEKTEQFAKSKGFGTMYLSTHDKQDFYKHLGYEFCPPVVSFGVSPNLIPEHLIKNLSEVRIEKESRISSTSKQDSNNHCDNDQLTNSLDLSEEPRVNSSLPQTLGPSPPPPPPGPPPPPPVNISKNGNKTITRFDPSAISWMRKNLVS